MWSLIRAELAYNWPVLTAGVLLIAPAAAVITAATSGTEIGTPIAFLPGAATMGVGFLVLWPRYRERRDRLLMLLPVAARQVALARLLVVVIPFALSLVVMAAVREALRPESSSGALLQIGLAVCLSLYGATCICHDLFAARPGNALAVRLAAAGGMLLAIFGLGAYVALTRGEPHPVLTRVFGFRLDFIWTFTADTGLLASPGGPTRFLLLSLAIGCLSVLTYSRRRSYLGP